MSRLLLDSADPSSRLFFCNYIRERYIFRSILFRDRCLFGLDELLGVVDDLLQVLLRRHGLLQSLFGRLLVLLKLFDLVVIIVTLARMAFRAAVVFSGFSGHLSVRRVVWGNDTASVLDDFLKSVDLLGEHDDFALLALPKQR